MSKKEENEPVFTKDQLVHAKRFAGESILLDALLDEKEMYTYAQAEKLVKDYLERSI